MAPRKKAEVLTMPQAAQVARNAKGGESVITEPKMRTAEKLGPILGGGVQSPKGVLGASSPLTGPKGVLSKPKADVRHGPRLGTMGGLSLPSAARGASAVTRPSAFDKWNAGLKVETPNAANVLVMCDVIGEDFWSGGGITAKTVSAQLRDLGTDADIEVHINSPGGDMFEGIAIYNTLAMHRGKITVKVLGLAASAASVIAMAGDEVQMGPASFIMVHDCWVVAAGNRHGFLETASWLEPFDKAMADLYARRTRKTPEEALAWMDNDGGEGTYFGAKEAIEMGLADGDIQESVTESTQAKEQGRVKSDLLKTELALCATMPRTKARALLNSIKAPSPTSKPDAVGPEAPDNSSKPDAAGPPSWAGAAASLLNTLRA